MDKRTEVKINNLIALRQLVTNVAVVVVGGTLGLLFIPNSLLKYSLIFIGVFYSCLFITNLSSILRELDNLVYSYDKEEKWRMCDAVVAMSIGAIGSSIGILFIKYSNMDLKTMKKKG